MRQDNSHTPEDGCNGFSRRDDGANAPVRKSTGWVDAVTIASLFAVDPVATGGVVVKALAGPARDRWLDICRDLLPEDCPVRRIPVQVSDDRLLGGLDLAATLRAGRPVHDSGILAEVNGGIAVLAMAERTRLSVAAQIASVIDERLLRIERDGISSRTATRFGVIALDEGLTPEEAVPELIADRLAFRVDLSAVRLRDLQSAPLTRKDIAQARAHLPRVIAGDEVIEALVSAATGLGITSVRTVLLALSVARIAAALAGRDALSEDDAMLAGRLVLAPRAQSLPQRPDDADVQDDEAEGESQEQQPDLQSPDDAADSADDGSQNENEAEPPGEFEPTLEDLILAVAEANIPAGLLNDLNAGTSASERRAGGAAGSIAKSNKRGRPCGTLRGTPGGGARISVIDTLRAAAPWQKIRRGGNPGRSASRIHVRGEDFRVVRYAERSQTATIFVVDASGSTALHRLAEAKGAVQLLLADCYIRRDSVALIAMRGRFAEVVLPPTRSLVRAKRSLAGLPGGGGTPMATGIDQAILLAQAERRRGHDPTIVLLTDGAANVARDGKGGRARAREDALSAARQARLAGLRVLLIDSSPRPSDFAAELAATMQARYFPLPQASAAQVSNAVRSAREQT